MRNDLISLASDAAKKLPQVTKAGVPDPSSSLFSLIGVWKDYKQLREQELTKRESIQANTKVELARIESQSKLLREYFSAVFTERKENFERSYFLLEQGLAKGDDRQIETALTMIVTLVKESPIKQAAEAMQQIKERQDGKIIDL